MADDARDPPDDEDEDAEDADAPPSSEDDPPPPPDEPLEGEDPDAPPIDPALVKRFLATKEARAIALHAARKFVPSREVENVAQSAMVRALKATPPRSEIVLPAWFASVCRYEVADFVRKRKRRKKYEGKMPTRVAREDAYTGAPVEDDDPVDPSYDPEADEEPDNLLGSHLDCLVAGHARDAETRSFIREHAEEKRPYKEIAARRGLTEAQIANRIYRFTRKYERDVKKGRRETMLFWIFGGLAVVAAALVAWWLLRHHAEDIRPDPSRFQPRPSPSASASTPVFLQALPPGPAPSDVPEPPKGPKP